MDRKEREEWLASLKVGDTVCYHSRYHGYMIETIEKITPTKQIKTQHNTYKNGHCRIGDWDSRQLEPVTKKVREHIREREIHSVIRNYNFDKLNLKQLEKLYVVIAELELE